VVNLDHGFTAECNTRAQAHGNDRENFTPFIQARNARKHALDQVAAEDSLDGAAFELPVGYDDYGSQMSSLTSDSFPGPMF
jgi:hypothetical protein